MPSEWQRHEATWLTWPQNEETWPGDKLARVEEIYLQMLAALLPHEKIHLFVQDEREQDKVRQLLRARKVNFKNLIPHMAITVDTWIRDYGPTFVKKQDGSKAWVKWIFNAWGGKYKDLMLDNQVFVRHAELVESPMFDAGFILEGGSIEVNGQGVVITTEQCLLNPNRNSHLTREQIEQNLKDYLGVSEIIWLKEGIEGDDTDGHIDDIVRFVNENTVVSAYEEDPSDNNHEILKGNWETLQEYSRRYGKNWNLIKLPMCGPVRDREGQRLPASYANFYIANNVVLLPVYSHKNDERAIKIITELFPTRIIVPIECTELVYGMGSIHCITQQEPQ
ncbi:MAG: agmatine deiminase family protein, partial [Candidatus Omnitrophica bacterium]|nr:agmatine deiminase family protein [Candidatus Omnitrophota bacterium]